MSRTRPISDEPADSAGNFCVCGKPVAARDIRVLNAYDFEVAVGEAAQDAVWKTQHPLTHHLAEDDPRRTKYLREYQSSVGRQVLAAIARLTAIDSCRRR
ncbi:MAG: hypothetical protein M3Y83_15020 [Actinomycetota bacterium]|nr:hypothetical protein [Actinomycetota bacterium]